MTTFVEQCRNEWKRLGVPDEVADEMAADLTADLEEAETEGVAAEDVLGSGADDPRSFAASWAAERGLVRRPEPRGQGRQRKTRLAAALGGLTVLAIVGAVLALLASPAEPPRPTPGSIVAPDGAVWVVRAARPPVARTSLWSVPARIHMGPSARLTRLESDDSGSETRTLGAALLLAGLAGIGLLTVTWWAEPGRWLHRRA